jgi:hypothetical protein
MARSRAFAGQVMPLVYRVRGRERVSSLGSGYQPWRTSRCDSSREQSPSGLVLVPLSDRVDACETSISGASRNRTCESV